MSQSVLPLSTPASYAEADYVITDSNRTMFDSLMQPDKWNSHGCLLIGAPASGKTHLAHIWQERFGAGIVAAKDLIAAKLPQDDYLIVENIDLPAEDSAALFHLLNAVRESNRRILLTAPTEPKQFITLPDLLSRLNALFVLHIPAPDEPLMLALLHKLFADRQLRVEEGVITYITSRAERSYDSLRSLIGLLDRSSLIKKQGVTIPLVRKVLENHPVQ